MSHVEIIVQKLFMHSMVPKRPRNGLRRGSDAKVIPPLCYFQWLRPPRTFETMSNWTIDLQSTSDSSETLIGWINTGIFPSTFLQPVSSSKNSILN